MKYITDFLGVILGFIAMASSTLKKYLKVIFSDSKAMKSSFDIDMSQQIFLWNGTKVPIKHIKYIIYGRNNKGEYLFRYIQSSRELKDYLWGTNTLVSRRLTVDKERAILLKNIFEKNNHKVLPSMWLYAPIGLVGCTITGGFRKGDFITLAGDNNQVCIYQGLDCEPSNLPIKIIDVDTFSSDDIFTKKTISTIPDKFESEYQAYVINKDATLNNKYLFLPWANGEFLFEESLYHNNSEELNKKIIYYFKSKNTKLIISEKNCTNRNNP